MLNLAQCIQDAYPLVPQGIISRFEGMVREYRLEPWVPNPQTGRDAFFIAPEVVERVGYSRIHASHTFERVVKSKTMEPPPLSLKLEGVPLQKFRRLLMEHWGLSFPRSSLRVVNWVAVFLLVDSIRKDPPQYTREEEIQMDLLLLSTLTHYPFTREWTVSNTLDTSTSTRRFDLVRRLPHCVEVVEIKLRPLSAEDISSTLGDKGYHHLATQSFQMSVPLHFIFVAPSITPAAERLLEVMPGIVFYSVLELRDRLYNEALEGTPPAGRWFLEKQRATLPRLWGT